MKKIGFCDRYGLTQAVLDGTKSMTRRLEKELDRLVSEYQMKYEEPIRIIEQKWDKGKNRLLIYAHTGIADTDREHVLTLNTRYKLGEIVAVGQSYKNVFTDDELIAFDDGLEIKMSKGWGNKLFVKPDLMPHQIQITDVRVERLQDISEEDCLKEGVTKHMDCHGNVFYYVKGMSSWCFFSREAFAALINSPGVGRKGLWEENPLVISYSFKLVK